MNKITKIYNLDSIRFYAAFCVFIQHSEEIFKAYHYSNFFDNKGIINLGSIGVTVFFTLSGFLITYILFREYNLKGNINYRNFYKNRFLRIWPLYFLTIFIYRVLLPFISSGYSIFTEHTSIENVVFQSIVTISPYTEWLLILLFLPHVLLALGKVFFPTFIWSIGVEEIFYLVWPRVIRYEKFIRNVILIIVAYLMIYFLSSYIWLIEEESNVFVSHLSQFVSVFLYMQRISCMAIGGIFAYIYLFKRDSFFHNHINVLYYTSLFVLVFISFFGIYLPFIINEIISILISIIILYHCINKKPTRLNQLIYNKFTNWAGKYSYGIYMYHTLAIFLVIDLLGYFNISSRVTLYFFSLISTLFVSYISYEFFEKNFLTLKKRPI
ncbi:MAG: acyltransferase [Chitinophagales bacterium]|nr:acyltransferase [Chitinophagales bacterium]